MVYFFLNKFVSHILSMLCGNYDSVYAFRKQAALSIFVVLYCHLSFVIRTHPGQRSVFHELRHAFGKEIR